MAAAQAAFLKWKREASGFEARRRGVEALLREQEGRVSDLICWLLWVCVYILCVFI